MDTHIETDERVERYVTLWHSLTARVSETAAAVLIGEIGKDLRGDRMNGRRTHDAADAPATEKQLQYLGKLGVVVPDGVTKAAASELIDAAVQ